MMEELLDHCTVFVGEIVCNPIHTEGENPLKPSQIAVFIFMSCKNVLLF